MIKLLSILKESLEVGKRDVDPDTGVISTFTGQDPETGKMSWDIENTIDLKFVYNKIDDLVHYMADAKRGSKEDEIRTILKTLRNKVARLH